MAKKIVRIDIPKDNTNEFLKLCHKIDEKHTADNANSPLNEFDMVDFILKKNNARTLKKDAKKLHSDGKWLNNEAKMLIGSAKGQTIRTEGTIYNVITLIRDRLLITHRINPENLNQWGFKVVISQSGGKTTVKVDIPLNKNKEMLDLADAIIEKHTADGANSPLSMFDMAAFETRKDDSRRFLPRGGVHCGTREVKEGQVREKHLFHYCDGFR